MLLALLGCTENHIVVQEEIDVFYQTPLQAVDVLMVVDNSCSMEPYQTMLSETFSEFVTWFVDAEVSWQIVVTTTDVDDPSIRAVIHSSDTDGGDVFAESVQVGIDGSGHEMGLEMARRVLETNSDVFREQATFSTVVLSDEEDGSPLAVHEYIRALEDLKGARERDLAVVSGIVTIEEGVCGSDWSQRGDRYIAAADMTGGLIGDICSDSLEEIVYEMGLRSSGLTDTFYLSEEPSPSTLLVSVDEDLLPCEAGDWTYTRLFFKGEERPAIVFDRSAMPASHAQIAVRYDRGGGSVSAFCPEAQ